jgi:hypothetical protein
MTKLVGLVIFTCRSAFCCRYQRSSFLVLRGQSSAISRNRSMPFSGWALKSGDLGGQRCQPATRELGVFSALVGPAPFLPRCLRWAWRRRGWP